MCLWIVKVFLFTAVVIFLLKIEDVTPRPLLKFSQFVVCVCMYYLHCSRYVNALMGSVYILQQYIISCRSFRVS